MDRATTPIGLSPAPAPESFALPKEPPTLFTLHPPAHRLLAANPGACDAMGNGAWA